MSAPTPTARPGTPVVLVTGSSTGIGRATVARFAREGWRVAATMRKPETSDVEAGDLVRLFPLDVTDEASIAAAVEDTVAAFGRIDALVNNAGYSMNGPVEAVTSEQLRRQFDTNVIGLWATTRATLPHLRASRGTVVNISSIGGRMAFPYSAAYHGTKFAVEGLSESMRFELAGVGVRVRVVEPGGIRTDFMGRSMEWASHPLYDAEMGRLRKVFSRAERSLPGPEPVADVILAATLSTGGRLRWTARPGPFIRVNQALPDAAWRRLIAGILARGR